MLRANLPHWDGVSEPATYMGTSLIPAGGRRNFVVVDVPVDLRDGRDHELNLETNGSSLVTHETSLSTEDFYSKPDTVTTTYYRECEELVLEHVAGASKVVAFDHNIRHAKVQLFAERATRKEAAASGETLHTVDGPVRFVHNDYTDWSAPQRVKDLAEAGGSYTTRGALLSPAERDAILGAGAGTEGGGDLRFAFINVWRPINMPVVDVPLAVCDAQSMKPADLVPCRLVYPNRTGQTAIVKWDPGHRWFYFSRMTRSECLLLKCWSSAGSDDSGRYTAHTAFSNPQAPADTPPRESIEVRCLVVIGGNSTRSVGGASLPPATSVTARARL